MFLISTRGTIKIHFEHQNDKRTKETIQEVVIIYKH